VRSLLHIGVHKTGTTSIQQFLREHIGEPRFPLGLFYPNAHNELAALALRPQRQDALQAVLGSHSTPGWRARAERHLSVMLERTDELILSTEALSLLCHADEVDRALTLLVGRTPHVVIYVRDSTAFLERFRLTLEFFDVPKSSAPDSVTHLSADSWLVDFSSRIALWREHCDVTVVDYDEVVARDHSVIPSFASLVGIPAVEYRLNTTESLLGELADSIKRSPEAMERFAEEMRRGGG